MMTLTSKVLLGSLALGAAYVFFGRPAAANQPQPSPQPQPGPFPIPPFPAPPMPPMPTPPGIETYKVGDSVLVPLLSLFPAGPSFPVDPTLLAGDEAVDAVRVLIDRILPAGLLQGRVTAYHYGGVASDGWKMVEPPAPSPPFPARVVTAKLLTTR